MYAVCMQELSLLVGSHSATLAQLCGTLWHGFLGLFKQSLSGEEAQLAREIAAHQRCSAQLREVQHDTRQQESEAAALRERVTELQAALDGEGRQLAKATRALRDGRQATEQLRAIWCDGAGAAAPASASAELTARLKQMDGVAAKAEAEAGQAGRGADQLRMLVRCVGQVQSCYGLAGT